MECLPPAFHLPQPGMLLAAFVFKCTTTAVEAFSVAWIAMRRCNVCSGEPSVPPFEAAALAISEHSPPSGQTAADTTGPDITALSGCLVDAGLMLGQTCRVCWAPNGTLVIPGQAWHSLFLCVACNIYFAASVAIPTVITAYMHGSAWTCCERSVNEYCWLPFMSPKGLSLIAKRHKHTFAD